MRSRRWWRHNGIFGGCWCSWFHGGLERPPGCEENPEFKKHLVETGVAHAALVMIGDDAVAWAEYGTPEELPNITIASSIWRRPT